MSAEDLSRRLPEVDASEPGGEGSGSLEGVPFPPPPRDDEIARLRDIEFPIGLRGYDRDAVDSYVRRVNRLIAELEVSRSPQSAVRHALEQVGEQTRDILQQAHEAAERITAQSRAKADERMRQAEREAGDLRLAAEQTVHSLDTDVEAIWQERQRLIDDTRRLADEMLRVADDASDRFPAVPVTDEQEAPEPQPEPEPEPEPEPDEVEPREEPPETEFHAPADTELTGPQMPAPPQMPAGTETRGDDEEASDEEAFDDETLPIERDDPGEADRAP
ncbi:MAG TPA: DivIVA domain-containing protein [Thermoleophilaceae bacterium]